jgi:hypothetical protein
MAPGWLTGVFAALMLMVAAVSTSGLAARLLAAPQVPAADPRGNGAGVAGPAIARLLMAVALAGKLAPGLATLPNAAWTVIFGAATAWFAWQLAQAARDTWTRALTGSGYAESLAQCAALLYAFLTEPAQPGASGTGGSQPTLAFAFALILIGCSIRDLDQLAGLGGHGAWLAAVTVAPAGTGRAGAGRAGTNRIALGGVPAGAVVGVPWGDAPFPGESLSAAFPGVPFSGVPLAGEPSPRGINGHRTPGFRSSGRHAAGRARSRAVPSDGSWLAGVLADPRIEAGSQIVISVTMTLLLVLKSF